MKSREITLIAATLGLMAASAAFLGGWGSLQRLGRPGVRVAPQPILGLDPLADEEHRFFTAGTHSIALPTRVLNYDFEPLPVQKVVYDWLPKDTTYGQGNYVAPDGFRIQNLAVLMGTDRTSIHQPQYCLTGSGWTIASSKKDVVRMDQPHPYDLPVMRLETRGRFTTQDSRTVEMSGVFVYWFVADGFLSNDHRERMWMMARELVLRRTLQRWAYVICFAPCPPGQEEAAYQRVSEFMAASVPEYQLTHGVRKQP